MRYCFVDCITAFEPGQWVEGYKNISVDDPVLPAHFPDFPLFPGAQLIEALAQLAGFLVERSRELHKGADNKRALLVGIEKAKFQGLVRPGDQLCMRCDIHSLFAQAAEISAHASVDKIQVAHARLRFVLRSIDIPAVHARQQNLYRLWTRTLKPTTPTV